MKKALGFVLSFALVFSLSGFLAGQLAVPVWEGRAVVCPADPAAPAALPEALTAGKVSACAIPGTDLLEIACRGESPEDAGDLLQWALDAMDTLLIRLECDPTREVLATAVTLIHQPSPWRWGLAAGALGAAVGFLFQLPPAEHRSPLALTRVLRRMGALALKYLLPILLTAALFAGIGQLAAPTPEAQATALVRLGSYDPDTAEGIAQAGLGLLDSLLAPRDIRAEAVGSTNLLRLTATGETPSEAEEILSGLLRSWPDLARHIPGAPGLTLLESTPGEYLSASSPALPGCIAAVFLWAVILFALAIPREREVCAGD